MGTLSLCSTVYQMKRKERTSHILGRLAASLRAPDT